MDYFDDLLNVFGYLRSNSRRAAESLNEAVQHEKHRSELTDEMYSELDDVKSLLRQAADLYGVQLDPPDQPVPVERPAEINGNGDSDTVFERIKLPADIDYEREYLNLVADARKAGFTNVHPEELLTAEEMRFAEEFNRKLDQQFADEVGLDVRDIMVVGIGVCLHLLRICLPKAVLPREEKETAEPEMPGEFSVGNSQRTAGGLNSIGELVAAAKEINSIFPNKNYIGIKPVSQILADEPLFQRFSDYRYQDRKSILGYDPLFGWLFGVYNILTDTVTVSDLHTFLPEWDSVQDYVRLSREYLPLRDVLTPFASGSIRDNRDQIVAGVIREAYVLLPDEIDFAGMAEHYDYCRRLTNMTAQTVASGADLLGSDFLRGSVHQILAQSGTASLINTIVIALHGLFRKDEDVEIYMVKSMKVVTIANFISSTVGSLPVLIDGNLLNADWGGLATALIEALHSTRLWIDMKAEFLKSAYLPTLQEQLCELDQYFEA